MQLQAQALKKTASALAPVIPLDRKLRTPLYQQIYEACRRAVVGGKLRPGGAILGTTSRQT